MMENHGDNESVSAHLQRMMHCCQDVNEVKHMVNEKLLISATLFKTDNKLSSARASISSATQLWLGIK
jgi:hypothetical protein